MRILLIQPDKLGDSILCLPAINHLRRSMPEAKITMLTRRTNYSVYEGTELVDELAESPLTPTLQGKLLCLARLGRRFDVAICFSRGGARRWLGMARLCGAKLTIGAPYPGRSSRNRNITRSVLMPDIVNYSDRAIRLVSALTGEPIGPWTYKVAVDPQGASDILRREGIVGAYAIVHVSTGGSSPAYPLDKWTQVARALADSEIERVILTAGPEGPIPDITHPRITNLAGRTGFPQLAGLIARADVVIAGSTLAVHLAAALGTGVVLVETTPKSNEQYVLYLPYSVPLRHLVVGPGDVPAEPDAIVQAFRSLRRVGGVETPFESYLIPADQRPLPMRICCEAGLGFDPH